MPSLFDIPEENGHYAYGNGYGNSHDNAAMYGLVYNKPLQPFYPFPTPGADHHADASDIYGYKSPPKQRRKPDDNAMVSVKIFAADGDEPNWAVNNHLRSAVNDDDLYHPVKMRANFIQKSPLPGRKNSQFDSSPGPSPDLNFEIYTNPSIEAIYRSLDRTGISTLLQLISFF